MVGVTNEASDEGGADLDLASLRSTYANHGLTESEVLADPLAQLGRWLSDAVEAGIPEPNAMVLATVDVDGAPSARVVLLKGLDASGVTFFTNLSSRKGRALAHEPRVALVLPWHAIGRQVRIEGRASMVSREETQEYFDTRPYGSQIGAWASPQSEVVADRAELEQRWARAAARFPAGSRVPAPAHWGGLRVAADVVELWQGRPDRMHDRLRYRRAASGWTLERLAP
jgi:pyridoxamine 5'-phosphate oxidase